MTASALVKRDFSIFYSFAESDLSKYLVEITAAASHISRHWAVSEEDRALVKRLFETPCLVGSDLRFDLTLDADSAGHTDFEGLLQDLAEKSAGKKFLLEGRDPLLCTYARGGLKESLHDAPAGTPAESFQPGASEPSMT